ncbi:GEVED domain-containing protein [Fluviicola sp.]|uniref:GEVED domain-containing protein n=1 Tax=Fluviicola sp. TaxID=1917219 RepID=UPI0031D17A8D
MKKKLLLGLAGLLVGIQSAFATTCPSAIALPAAPTMPYTDPSVVCGGSNDIDFASNYDNGLEALYTWTPATNYSNVTVSYTGQSWVGIFIYQGCPTSGGTLVTSQTTSGTSLTTASFSLTAGVQYYIMFDTWPSPPSPCAGSFTINGTVVPPCTAPPTAGTVSAASNPICPSVNNVLSVTGASSGTGLTYQWQSSTTGAAGSFANIAGATSASYTSNQTVNTYYRRYVTCSGMTDTSAALLVTTNSFINCYCTSNSTSTADEEILNVSIGTLLNNSSTCSTTGGPGSIQNQYSNYANLPATNLVRGASYPLSVQIGTCGGNYNNTTRVYIDFNQNGLFTDPGETVLSPAYVNGPHTETGTLVIPVGAVLGQTRMRVVNVETTGTVNPCGTYTWGETEDYIVNIICPTLTGTGAVDQGICSGTAATFTGTPSYSGATISWWDAPTGGTQLGTGNSFTTPSLTSSTTYYVQEDYTGCPSSARADIEAIVTAVAVTLVPINVTCNGLSNGSFTQTAVSCGVAPFQYSTDQVSWGPIPTNLAAGTYFFYVQDNVGGVSAPIQVIITQPSAPTALNAYNVTFFNAMATWTPQGNETTWNVQYGPAGFTLGSSPFPTMTGVTNDTVQITGLTEDTDYQFYVQAGCTTSSAWAGPFAFSTDVPFSTWDSQCGPGFTPIQTTGTALNLADDASTPITTTNPVSFQGVTSNTVTVSNNGWIQFGAVTLNAWNVDLDDEEGNVYWQETTIGGDNYLIVEWFNRPKFSTVSGQNVTFEIAINQTTGEIFYLYDDKVFGGSQSAYDYAGNFATISAVGPMSTTTISYNSQTYLQNNSCVRFYTALCPNVQNMVTLTYADDAQLNWDAGPYGETNWTIVYGLDGFDPTVAGQEIGTLTVNSSDVNFGGTLTQLTCYDAYIYSECQADSLTSDGFLVNFCTKPLCSDITGLAGATDVDSLELTWNWTASSMAYPVTGFNIQYGMTGFTLGNGFIQDATGINFADTVQNTALMASGVYQVYVQAECDNGTTVDTSNWVGPITLVMPVTNDVVCSQEVLALNQTYTFNNTGAGVSLNEANIAPPSTGAQTTTGWINNTLNGTLWYTFVAPPSGSVRVNSTAIPYNGQAAVYSATNCADFNTFTLVAANDNEIGGTSLAPNFTVCGLTPGTTYYIMYDKFDATTGNFSLKVTEIVLEGGSALPLTEICYGANVDLFTTITGNNTGGTWSSNVPSVNASITGSDFESNGLAYTTFDFEYRVVDGCAYDSIISQVKVYAPSNAGQDGVITACRNEPIDLLAGLNGNSDLNGDWYDPSDVLLSSSQIWTANFPGQYNYDYISGNGVCPDDTANVVVTVTNCNWLSVDENALEAVSLYPNPSTGVVFIESTFTGNFDLVVTDINGRTIQSGTSVAAGTNTVNLKEVERGTYFFKLSTESAEKVFRVVIQ